MLIVRGLRGTRLGGNLHSNPVRHADSLTLAERAQNPGRTTTLLILRPYPIDVPQLCWLSRQHYITYRGYGIQRKTLSWLVVNNVANMYLSSEVLYIYICIAIVVQGLWTTLTCIYCIKTRWAKYTGTVHRHRCGKSRITLSSLL